MRKVSENVYAELFFWGCNPGFVATREGVLLVDTPQQPIDAMRWRERILDEFGPIRYLVNTEPHADHIRGNAYFPDAEVIGQEGMVARYAEAIPAMTAAELGETIKQVDPDSFWLFNHPEYPPNPPTRTFADQLTLQLGDLEIQIIHTPGHTAPQTAVYIPRERVVFTGDNVFHKCKSYVQEADPWQWLEALDRIGKLDVDVIVPGHGVACDKSYLKQQAQILQNWIGFVEDCVRRGLTDQEALAEVDATKLDPYPIGQRLFPRDELVTKMNVTNVYKHVRARQAQPV